ncbi:MAG: hypothetical protein EBZ48_18020, partial [Proteobacteria bacterium]|nr:hypothetical protein [Pseudomonadota bacterium]
MPENIAMPPEHSLLQMISGSSPIVQGVLFILILLSIMSWAIAIAKVLQFRKAQADSEQFTALFWETRNFSRVDDSTRRLAASPLARLFSAGYREVGKSAAEKQQGNAASAMNSVERVLRRTEQEESAKLERGLTFLATV